jgi:hypothetical protein
MLLIASATEFFSGVENLWKCGPSAGHHTYPDFGQYIPMNGTGMRIHVIFHGMCFCHAFQVLIAVLYIATQSDTAEVFFSLLASTAVSDSLYNMPLR